MGTYPIAFLADALMEQGKLDDATAALTRARAAPRPESGTLVFLHDSRARLSILRGEFAGGLDKLLEVGRLFEAVGGRTRPSSPGARRPRLPSCGWATRTKHAGWQPRNLRSPAPGARPGRSAQPSARWDWWRAAGRASCCWRRPSRWSPTHPRDSSTRRRAPSWELHFIAPTDARRRATTPPSTRAGDALRHDPRRTSRDRASGDRCAATTDRPARRRVAHTQRAARGRTGGRGPHEP